MQNFLKHKDNVNCVEMFNEFFIKQQEYITVEELSKLVDIKNINDLDKGLKIYNVAVLQKATKNDISFLSNTKYIKDLENTNCGFCLINRQYAEYIKKDIIPIMVDNPHYVYTVILNILYFVPIFTIEKGISKNAFIDPTAKIGNNVEIQSGVVIDRNVVIGDDCKICANTVINHNCKIGNSVYIGSNSTISYSKIGNNVIIHSGANIGQCGFGFVHEKGFNYKIPQLGIVEIEDFVEIGSGTCVDRGAFNNTKIKSNTKIDNLNQIAHGVEVGNGCFFASQVGISGSSKIGNFVQFGGQTGVAGHLEVGDMVQSAGKSGIIKNVESRTVIGGYPAINIKDWHKTTIALKQFINKKKNDNKE